MHIFIYRLDQSWFTSRLNIYFPLTGYRPGEAQVDFGKTDFYKNDNRLTGKYLNLNYLMNFQKEKRVSNDTKSVDRG